ncbi:phage tail tape measure protein [Virgibacillus sp. CBA3643]|uniref:phage tail tape measure protein n=1 Tax=Virgibacillus sp. CBA3643 TaxID=2942278 RepID=UPI0035A3C800
MAKEYSVVTKIQANISDFNSKIKEADKKAKNLSSNIGNSMKKVGGGMKSAGGTLTKYVTAPLAAVGGIAFAAANDVDEAYKTIISGTGATGDALDGLKEDFDEVFTSVPDSADMVSNALATLNTLTGATGDDLQGLTENVLDASRALEEDGAENAEKFGKALAQWGIPAEEGEAHLDKLFTLTQDYGVGLGEVSGHLTKYGSVLGNAGFEMDESAELMARMEANGIQVSRIMPGLNSAFRNWADEGKNSKEELQKTIDAMQAAETETEALSIATENFGAEGAQRMTTAVREGAIPALDELGDVMEDSEGAVAENNEATETFGDKLGELKNKAMDGLKPVGDIFLQLAEEWLPPLMDGIEKVAGWFDGLSPKGQKVVVAVGAIAAAIPPLLIVLGSLIGVIGGMAAAAGALNIGLLPLTGIVAAIVVGIGALIAAGVAIVKNWDMIKAMAVTVWGAISDWFSNFWQSTKELFSSAISAIGNFISNGFNKAKNFIVNTFNSIVEFFQNTWNFIKNVFNTVITWIVNFAKQRWQNLKNNVTSVFTAISNFISKIWNGIKQFFSTIISWIVDFVKSRFNNLKNNVTNVFNAVSDFISNIWNSIKSFLSDTIGNIVDSAISGFKTLFDNVKEIFGNIWDSVTSTFDDIVEGAKALPGKIGDGIGSMADKVMDGVTSVINTLASTLGKGVNGVIGGINWVLDKIGVDSEIPEWDVPEYAQGTGSHPGGLAKLNDGKGNNSGQELIQTPDGKTGMLKGKDVYANLPKGSKVLSAKKTRNFLSSIPAYANGVGDFLGNTWEGAKNVAGKAKDATVTGAKMVGAAGKAAGQKVGEWAGNVWDYASNPSKLLDIALDLLGVEMPKGGSLVGDIAKGGFTKVKDGAVDFIKDKFDEFTSSAPSSGSGGSGRWSGVATRALKMTGQYTKGNLDKLLYQMQTESGGNPQAINDWDINAKRGTPSKGLMQVIDPTFAANKMPGFNDIWNPLDNILASIRYAVGRYGTLSSAYRGVGYETGGIVGKEHLAKVGEGNKREAIIPLQNKRYMAPFADAVFSRFQDNLKKVINFDVESLLSGFQRNLTQFSNRMLNSVQSNTSSLAMEGMTGNTTNNNTTNNYEINFNVEKMNGDKGDAKTFMNEIVKGVKAKGGNI